MHILKRFSLVIFVVLAALMSAPAGYAYMQDFGDNTELSKSKTCKGTPVAAVSDTYFFGIRGNDGYCATHSFLANSLTEAEECAQATCKDCQVEDLTPSYHLTGSNIPGFGRVGDFCPAK